MTERGVPLSPWVREVRRIDQSPTCPTRWALELSCGHDVWMTAKRRPALYVGTRGDEHPRMASCYRCKDEYELSTKRETDGAKR